MKRLQSILFASLLTLSLCAPALAGQISGRSGQISGRSGQISGAPSEMTEDLYLALVEVVAAILP